MLRSVTDRIRINERRQPGWLDNDRLRADCAAGILAIQRALSPAMAAKPAEAAPAVAETKVPEAAPAEAIAKPAARREPGAADRRGFPTWAIGAIAAVVVLAVVLFFIFKPKGRNRR